MEEPKKLTFAEEMALLKKDKGTAAARPTAAKPPIAKPVGPETVAPASPREPSPVYASFPKTVDTTAFARELKKTSLYPTFRAIVSLNFLFCVLISIILIGASLVAFTQGSMGMALFLFFAGAFAVILGKVLQELALMLADAADATVYIAAHTKKE